MDPLIGLKENVIIGKLIPAGTGMKRYRSVKLDTDKVLSVDDELDFTEDMDIAEDVEMLETEDVEADVVEAEEEVITE